MAPIQEKLAAVARELLLDLIAIEMAKAGKGGDQIGGHLEAGLQRISQRPRRLESDEDDD